MSRVGVMQRLRAAGLRPTVARIGVLQVLLSSSAHALSRDEIYRQLYLRGTPVSVGAVMLVVAQLSKLGVVHHNGIKVRESDRYAAVTSRL